MDKNENNQCFPGLKLLETEPKRYIGIDTYDPITSAYCLVRKFNGETDILMVKTMSVRADFDEEVNNLAKYFNATIIKETK